MQYQTLLSVVALLLILTESAQAKDWRRAKGTLYFTAYADSDGYTLNDLPQSARVLRINRDLRRSSNVNGIKSSCKDVKRLKQRVCKSFYYYTITGHGSCLFMTQGTIYNYTSASRNLYMYLEGVVQCPTG